MRTEGYTTEQLIERFEDRREIKNLMGKYVTSLLLNRDADLLQSFWCSRKDICLGFNNGWYLGRSDVGGYYAACGNRLSLVAQVLKKALPDQLAGKTDEELYGIGEFEAKPITNSIIVIAEDRKTAKGVWMTEGSNTEVHSSGPETYWTWGVYAADFVLEADPETGSEEWKLWHLQNVEDIHHLSGQDWTLPNAVFDEVPEFQAMKDFHLPAFTVETENRRLYSPDRPFTPLPDFPIAYKTFAETFSYGYSEVAK